MNDAIDELVIDVRATTDGFASDLQGLRSSIDSSILDPFERAGGILEKGLLTALRKGSLGFDDLKRVALSALEEIASHALQSGFGSIFGGSPFGLDGVISQSLGSVLGLPGRATGGPVSPGTSYLVGERGPEVFVPTSSGRIEPDGAMSGQARDVRVAIQLSTPRGTSTPTAMRRSSRQVASAVKRALQTA
ncbi:MAG: tail tape measure protein [Pseudomonadota bacterium]